MNQIPKEVPEQASLWETQQPLEFLALKQQLAELQVKYEKSLDIMADMLTKRFYGATKSVDDLYTQIVFSETTHCQYTNDLRRKLAERIKLPSYLNR